MTKFDFIKEIILKNGGIAKTSAFKAEGLSNYDVANMCNAGLIRRLRHGYYQLETSDNISEEYLIATLIPESIVCVESALFYYGYSDLAPRAWAVAVPRDIARTKLKIDTLFLKVYYIQDKWLNIGKTAVDFNGVRLSIYDRERTICDCFKYRSKMDNETFSKALNAYVADSNKNLINLSKYAKSLKVYKKLNELIEVLLNA
ncbi:MAG: type IV toxin-antitoxin system AbiEi family antitoxin domain-containing protein [Candidatus Riflebacteria bacterium]|nr:type IV toxin-antitoxin system AbiEi family antitoxin domain-containing protein [Candidatus Riflebacteria bacterium]